MIPGMKDMPQPPSRKSSHDCIIIVSDVKKIPRLNSRKLINGYIASISGVAEMPLPPSRKSNHGDVNIVQNMPLPLSGKPNHGDIIITSGVKEIPVPNSRKSIMWMYNHYIWHGGNASTSFQNTESWLYNHYIVTCKSIAKQRPQHTHGQKYNSSVFFVSVQLSHVQ
jgi:hypothetical protein